MENCLIEFRDDALYLTFHGEITIEITAGLKKEIDKALQPSSFSSVVVNLSEVAFIDSSGIGFLVALNTRLISLSRKMFLFKPSAQVKKTLDLVQLSSFFTIAADEDELLALLPE